MLRHEMTYQTSLANREIQSIIVFSKLASNCSVSVGIITSVKQQYLNFLNFTCWVMITMPSKCCSSSHIFWGRFLSQNDAVIAILAITVQKALFYL